MNITNNIKALLLRGITKKKNIEFDVKKSSKVLMLRYDRIGDMVITTPVFRELKKTYPNIEINVLASQVNHIILKNNPYIDNIYLNTKNNIFLDLPVLFKLRKKNFDVCFEFDHSVVRHAIFRLKIINPKKVISVEKDGRYGLHGSKLQIYDYYTEKPKNNHFRDIWLATLNPFNVIPKSKQYDIFCDELQKNKAIHFLSQYPNKILIGVNLEGAVKGKIIQYIELMDICKGLHNINRNIQIIILSTPQKEQSVKEMVINMRLDYVSIAYRTNNILDASALIDNLHLIITPDTSIAHIASTFNIPVITIHENNDESYKLFAPTSDLNRTVFSSNRNSLKGFSVSSILVHANDLMKLMKSER
jgi:ADP-heptose:LPS heptosyltransferase